MGTRITRRFEIVPAGDKQKRMQLTGSDVQDAHEGVNREMRDACIHRLGAAYTSHKTYL